MGRILPNCTNGSGVVLSVLFVPEVEFDDLAEHVRRYNKRRSTTFEDEVMKVSSLISEDALKKNAIKFPAHTQTLDLPVIRFHDLRHTTATLLLSLGYSIKDIGEWLGHGDYATTANTYAHLDFRRKTHIGDTLAEAIAL
jgi:integrase